MKHVRTFENINIDEPSKFDYVLCKENLDDEALNNFLMNL